MTTPPTASIAASLANLTAHSRDAWLSALSRIPAGLDDKHAVSALVELVDAGMTPDEAADVLSVEE